MIIQPRKMSDTQFDARMDWDIHPIWRLSPLLPKDHAFFRDVTHKRRQPNSQTVSTKDNSLSNMTQLGPKLQQSSTQYQQYFFHPDHLGSSSFISDAAGDATQFLAYLPFGEHWVDQHSSYDSPYKFSGKELDAETGYNYFGARYYDSGLSVWLSVDPMAEERNWVSPYSYCQNKPLNRIDPTGALDWIPPTDGSGDWTAQKGDGHWKLSKQARIPLEDAKAAVISANQNRGQVRTSETMVYEGDKVHVGSRPGYSWSSGPQETGSVGSSSNSNSPSTDQNTTSNTNNAVKTVNAVSTVVGATANTAVQVAAIPTVGYNIAYSPTLLKGVNYLKPVGYWASGLSVGSDVILSLNGQQSWAETGANTAVTGIAIGVGGWAGLLIQLDYQAIQFHMKMINEHPEYFEGIRRGGM